MISPLQCASKEAVLAVICNKCTFPSAPTECCVTSLHFLQKLRNLPVQYFPYPTQTFSYKDTGNWASDRRTSSQDSECEYGNAFSFQQKAGCSEAASFKDNNMRPLNTHLAALWHRELLLAEAVSVISSAWHTTGAQLTSAQWGKGSPAQGLWPYIPGKQQIFAEWMNDEVGSLFCTVFQETPFSTRA